MDQGDTSPGEDRCDTLDLAHQVVGYPQPERARHVRRFLPYFIQSWIRSLVGMAFSFPSFDPPF